MAERTVWGVDFSGGGKDDAKGNTWITEGRLDGEMLTIDDCRAISRDDLTLLLKDLSDGSVAAMDFPFGIPQEFMQHLGIHATTMPDVTMPDVWNSVTGEDKDVRWFKSKCDESYTIHDRELKRTGDKDYNESMSPLNLRMYRMTFHGMSMLDKLWKATNCQVPPLQEAERNGPILLETMPGAVLSRIGFPYEVYKGYKNKNDAKSRPLRVEILDKLEKKSGITVQNLSTFCNSCLGIHDCLDSLIAAIAAAKWVNDETSFWRPEDQNVLAAAQREGWIYAPKRKPQPSAPSAPSVVKQ